MKTREKRPQKTMAIIVQKNLFGWESYEKFDGLKRLEEKPGRGWKKGEIRAFLSAA